MGNHFNVRFIYGCESVIIIAFVRPVSKNILTGLITSCTILEGGGLVSIVT
jgi:hypothetical protein